MNLDRIIAVRNNKTVYRDKERSLKVFNVGYSKADVLNEALNQARIEETGLPIPKLLEVTMIDGKWTLVSEYIKGKSMARLISENPEKKDGYIELLVGLQIEMHSKKSPLLNRMRDKMGRQIEASDLPATVRYDLYSRLSEMPRHGKICHGDFNPSNIIITDDGKPYIIDWSHATQGNASADAARTYLIFLLSGDTDGAEKYLGLFCEKSGTDRQYVDRWMPVVAASQLLKGNAAERKFLHSWIKVSNSMEETK